MALNVSFATATGTTGGSFTNNDDNLHDGTQLLPCMAAELDALRCYMS